MICSRVTLLLGTALCKVCSTSFGNVTLLGTIFHPVCSNSLEWHFEVGLPRLVDVIDDVDRENASTSIF